MCMDDVHFLCARNIVIKFIGLFNLKNKLDKYVIVFIKLNEV